MDHPGAADFVPPTRSLTALADAVRECRGCTLYHDADQAVFGAGPRSAHLMLVGEQPGDREDRTGQPFVGPAGRLLDKALDAASVDRAQVYVTNAVKHFKFTERGKRRIHQKPSRTEVVACRPWLLAELAAVAPDTLVLMGATAAQSLLGNDFRLTAHRGEVLALPDAEVLALPDASTPAPDVVVTIHPSAVLRGPDDGRAEAFESLVADLRFAAGLRTKTRSPRT
ncbi:uracil-DNA glycosylase [Mycolicibacterium canariasense]|uniref:Type-4 uracil-DNA glycosylase n=1 Tax=Mycolicibacterium canariasense TaxID=228230 RepID=A0A100WG14_MYCCR|nr:UdgX family uracil-DNA binding protein [Mycolicibacterium canariasense]MCV7209599.1 UdgX family uracil-DNA binding protein [Mycolicibacterium canariasense]ORU99530.1 uracil-DNA glycosylase [Mycolicibacterium canariasense]GAS97611.1 uracil-DNA glycosylase [Mycolicibacterium canariasense]